MSVLKYFKNTPQSPYGGPTGSCHPSHGRQDPNVIFFWNLQRGPWLGGGGLSPPNGRQGSPPYISPGREPKNLGKKRGVRRRKAAKLC